jgi:hypothetical protein
MAEKRDPVSEYLAEIGSRGGKAKVRKGIATLTQKERSERAKQAAAARWGTKKKTAAKKAKKK